MIQRCDQDPRNDLVDHDEAEDLVGCIRHPEPTGMHLARLLEPDDIALCVIAGIGHALPTAIVTNHDLAARLDTTDEWIRTRSGIRQRHIATPDTGTADLAVEAGAHALKSAAVDAVDLVILATSTPDRPVRRWRPR